MEKIDVCVDCPVLGWNHTLFWQALDALGRGDLECAVSVALQMKSAAYSLEDGDCKRLLHFVSFILATAAARDGKEAEMSYHLTMAGMYVREQQAL